MHSGMVARFMFHEYIDHTYLPHPGGGFSVARKAFFLLSLHIAATSASHQKATLSNIISNRPNTPPSKPHHTIPHPHIPSQHPTTHLIPYAPHQHPKTIFFFSFHLLEFTRTVAVCFEVRYAVVVESEGGKGEG